MCWGPSTRTDISFLYAANLPAARRPLWNSLLSFKLAVGSDPWVVLDDFDIVKERNEANNANQSGLLGIEDSRSFLADVDLTDHPWLGNFYT